MTAYLPIGVIVDDGGEYFSLVKIVVGGDEVEDDPVAAVRLDPVLQLLVVQTEQRVGSGHTEQQLVSGNGRNIFNFQQNTKW